MATSRVVSAASSGGKPEVRTDFSTKEGWYRNVRASEHCRPSRQPLFGKELSPVQVSFVSCKDKDGLLEWVLFNSGKELYFYPFEGVGKIPDLKRPIDKRVYRSPTIPVCHDFNSMTRSKSHLDLIVGFSTGPLQYLNPLERRAICAFNEDGSIDSTRVSSVKWVPGSEHTFVSTHVSGNLFVWTTENGGKGPPPQNYVLHSEITDAKIYTVKPKSKSPILCRWSVGHGAITSAAFSPNAVHIAICSQDGFLRIYDFHKQEFYGRMRSYFGALLCVCWSPDGKYVVTGGEDDLVTVWSFDHRRVIARGEGHKSYVSAVAFDPYKTVLPESSDEESAKEPFSDVLGASGSSPTLQSQSRSSLNPSSNRSSWYLSDSGINPELDITAYRLGSVGQDTQLCLWDLSGDALRLRRPFARSRSRMSRQASRPVSSGDPTSSIATASDKTGDRGSARSDQVQDTASSKRNSSSVPSEGGKDTENSSLKSTSPTPNHVTSSVSTSRNSTSTPEVRNSTQEDSDRDASSQLSGDNKQDSGTTKTEPGEVGVVRGRGDKKEDATPDTSQLSLDKSKKDKKQKKEKSKDKEKEITKQQDKEKEKSEPKKVRLVHRNSLNNVRKVIKFVSSGITSQTYGHHNFNGRRQVGNFETCNSDDIAPKMHDVNLIEPLVKKKISHERLTALVFREDCIVTASQEGYIHTWVRPDAQGEPAAVEGETNKEPINPGINSPKPGATGSEHDPPSSSVVKNTSL